MVYLFLKSLNLKVKFHLFTKKRRFIYYYYP